MIHCREQLDNLGLLAALANIVDSKGKLTKSTSKTTVIKQQRNVPLQLHYMLAKTGLQRKKYKPQPKLQIT